MLIGLRIVLGLFTLLILFLCTYIQITDHFSLLPYVQFILSCFFILVGINEFISGRKSMSIPFFSCLFLRSSFSYQTTFATYRMKSGAISHLQASSKIEMIFCQFLSVSRYSMSKRRYIKKIVDIILFIIMTQKNCPFTGSFLSIQTLSQVHLYLGLTRSSLSVLLLLNREASLDHIAFHLQLEFL